MLYRVVGLMKGGSLVSFCQENEEYTFSTRAKAQSFLENIKSEQVLPSNYQLKIEKTIH